MNFPLSRMRQGCHPILQMRKRGLQRLSDVLIAKREVAMDTHIQI